MKKKTRPKALAMLLPFAEYFDNVLRGDRSIARKMVAGTAVGAFVGVLALSRMGCRNVAEAVAVVGGTTLLATAGVVFLSLVDSVRQRIETAQRVSWLLRVYFKGGLISLIAWVVSVMLLTFAITMLMIA